MWKRLDISTLRNIGGGSKTHKRAFGKDGNKWPRIIIGIMHNRLYNSDAVSITCSRKKGPNDWWVDEGIPFELLKDVIELIEEFKEKPQEKE